MKSTKYIVIGGLLVVSLSATGCHSPSLSSLQPAVPKVAVGVVGSTEYINSKEFKEYTDKILTDNGVVLDPQPADSPAKAAEALSTLAANKDIDLVITEGRYSQQISEAAKNSKVKKFGLVGAADSSAQASIRQDSINRENQSFVAGYLIASGIPQDQVGVIVKTPGTTQSREWQGLREGIHYAGMTADPFALTIDEIMAPDGIEKLKSRKTKVFILLDPVSEGQLARLHESGKWLFSLHDLPKMYPSVIAKPASVFTEGVQEQVQALLNNSWQPDSAKQVTGATYFDLVKPEAVAGAVERKKSVEDALRNGAVQPEQYSNPPLPDKTKKSS